MTRRKKNPPWPYLELPPGIAVLKYRWSERPWSAPRPRGTGVLDLERLEAAIARRRRAHVGPYGHQKIRFRWWLDDHRRRATLFLRAVVFDVETHRLGDAA